MLTNKFVAIDNVRAKFIMWEGMGWAVLEIKMETSLTAADSRRDRLDYNHLARMKS